jgi:hypothetical protein
MHCTVTKTMYILHTHPLQMLHYQSTTSVDVNTGMELKVLYKAMTLTAKCCTVKVDDCVTLTRVTVLQVLITVNNQ